MLKKIWNYLTGKKEEKIDRPDPSGIIKINDVAKDSGIYDDENKIIELLRNGKITKIKYSESEVEALREQGIPVDEERYSEDYNYFESSTGGGFEHRI